MKWKNNGKWSKVVANAILLLTFLLESIKTIYVAENKNI